MLDSLDYTFTLVSACTLGTWDNAVAAVLVVFHVLFALGIGVCRIVLWLESGRLGALVGSCEETGRPIFGWTPLGKALGSGVPGLFDDLLALFGGCCTSTGWRGTGDVMMDNVDHSRTF